MSEYELPSPGTYNAVAIERTDDQGLAAYARWSLTKAEKKQVSATFKLIDAAGNPTVTWYGSFSSTAIGNTGKTVAKRTVESLRYMGFKGNDFLELETQKLDQIVSIVIEHEVSDKDGKTYLKASWINQPGGGVIKIARPLSLEDKRKFAAVMRNNLATIPDVDGERHESASVTAQGTSAPPKDDGGWGNPGNAEGPPPPADDDIPFLAIAELYLGRHHQPGGRAV